MATTTNTNINTTLEEAIRRLERAANGPTAEYWKAALLVERLEAQRA